MMNELAEKIKNGDEQALYKLIRQYEPWLSAVIYNASGGKLGAHDTEEIAADSFIALWMNREKIIPDKCKAYLCRVAKNKAISLLRKQNRYSSGPLTEEEAAELIYISDSTEWEEAAAALKKALDQLEETDREILVRRFYYYQPIKDISEKTGLNESTVKSRLYRGLKKLRKILEEDGFV